MMIKSSIQRIASDSDTDESLTSMHQSITAKIKNSASKNWIGLDVIIKHSVTFYDC